MKKCILILISVIISNHLFSGELHELRTGYITENNYAGIDVYQKVYVAGKNYYLLREQSIFLPLGKSTEMALKFPYINTISDSRELAQTGDIRIGLNFATEWFKRYILINYFLEYNSGSGTAYNDLQNFSMQSYGYFEWRTGLIFLKKRKLFSIHANLFYVFRGHKSGTDEKENNFFDGMTINVFEKETYERVFGFNPDSEKNFFYKGNFANDNLEYNLALNTELFYPFVPFTEFTFSHDFTGEYRDQTYPIKGPGSGYFRSQISVGTKFFMADDRFVLKTAFTLPVLNLRNVYDYGFSLGARIDF